MKKKTIACALLLTAVTCAVTVTASIGETQARYVNKSSWLTVAEPTKKADTFRSDSLQLVDAPPLVNLLGSLPEEGCEIPIILKGDENRFGQLIWTVDHPDAFEVGMRIGSRELHSGDQVGVTKNASTRLVLFLKPKASISSEEITVNVHVSWGNVLSGTFRGAWKSENPVSQMAAVLKAPSFFGDTGVIPVEVMPKGAGQLMLSLKEGETLAPFPEGTRYSTDQGKSWYRLTGEDRIALNTETLTNKVLLLDVSGTQLDQKSSVTVTDEMGHEAVVQKASPPDYITSGRVLTVDRPLSVSFSEALAEGQLTYRLEQLTCRQGQTDYYPAAPEGLIMETDEKGERLTLSVGDVLPQPGTYRLLLSRSYQGTPYWETSIPFFINYAEDGIQTGGAEQ